jgi:hypothetical protein
VKAANFLVVKNPLNVDHSGHSRLLPCCADSCAATA